MSKFITYPSSSDVVTIAGPVVVSGSVSVSNFPSIQNVDVTNFPSVQSINGSVSISNFPSIQPISGTIAINNFPVTQTIVRISGTVPTYSAMKADLTIAAAATDIFTLTGNASKVIRILQIGISGFSTTAESSDIWLVKRSSANSGGTFTTPSICSYDSTNPAPVGIVTVYTANPTTLGAQAGILRSEKVFLDPANTQPQGLILWDFRDTPGQSPTLRSSSEILSVYGAAQTITGGSVDIWIEWTESTS